MLRVLKTTSNVRMMLVFILLLLLLSTNVNAASTEQVVYIAVNDEIVEFTDARPLIDDGAIFLPLRAMTSLLEASIIYDANENTVTVKRNNQSMKIYINEKMVETEAIEKLPISIKTINGRIMLPLRFMAEQFGLDITFYEAGLITRLIDRDVHIQYTDEQLYEKYKDQIEKEKQKWKATSERQEQKELKSGKVAYLTFDDGPTNDTSKILDILQEYDVKATFFMLEPNIRSYKKIVKRMVAEGHTIASHSVSHDKDKVYRNPKALLNEMNTTRATLLKVTGLDSKLIRVPYGSKPYLKKEFRDMLASNNLQVWDWNVDSNDWRHSPEEIISTVKKQVINLEHEKVPPVILFHNGINTVQSLSEIIEFLKAEGYLLKAYDPEHHVMVNFWNDERL